MNALSRSRRVDLRDDRGSVTVWAISATVACVLIIGLVIDGGTMLRARSDAFALASSAARAGAQELDSAAAVQGLTVLDPVAAERAALDYLAAHDATGTVAITDETITVTVTERDQPPTPPPRRRGDRQLHGHLDREHREGRVAMTRLRALIRGVASLAALAALLIGLPVLLSSWGRLPGSPSSDWWDRLSDTAVSDTTVFVVLTLAAWVAWATFAAAVVVEFVAGIPRHPSATNRVRRAVPTIRSDPRRRGPADAEPAPECGTLLRLCPPSPRHRVNCHPDLVRARVAPTRSCHRDDDRPGKDDRGRDLIR